MLQEFVSERVQEGGRVQRHGDGGPDQHYPGYHRYAQCVFPVILCRLLCIELVI